MIRWLDLPKEAMEDCFKPPKDPCEVECIHCGNVYSSSEIVWVRSGERGFWRCPVEDCGGAGFGFDIYPTDPAEAQKHGIHFLSFDEDDEEGDEAG
jgi:hypothetical protein